MLDKARQEQVFTSIARTSKPAISVAASGVANGGWATLASAVPDVANLGVSIERMATLVEDEVSALARTIRDTKDKRATQEAENPITLESLDAFLATKEREYAKALVGIINSLLETSVYSPLVSYTTQFATDKVIAALMPPTEVERRAASNDNVLEVIDRQADASISHYDDLLMKWRGVNAGVNLADMTPEERAEAFETHVEGTGKSLAEVINDYKGCSLELYRDGQNKLYAQRPQFDDYVAAVSDGKPAGPAEFLAAAIRHNQPITIVDTATENVRTYHPDGRVDSSSPTQAIKLECTPGQQGALDHITPAGLAGPSDPLSTGADCFYTALVESLNSPEGITIAGERLDIANCMGKSEACKLLYHNNSLDGAVKHFAGYQPQHASSWGNVWTREKADVITQDWHGPDVTPAQEKLFWQEVRAAQGPFTREDMVSLLEASSMLLGGPAARVGTKAASGALRLATRKLLQSVESPAGYIFAETRGFVPKARMILINRRIDQVVKQSERSPRKRGSTVIQYKTEGGFSAANSAFDKITKGCHVSKKPGAIRHATLPDGREVVVRPFSREGSPTLDIQKSPFHRKFRFNDTAKPD